MKERQTDEREVKGKVRDQERGEIHSGQKRRSMGGRKREGRRNGEKEKIKYRE